MILRKSAVSGIKWSSLSQFGRQITQLVTTALLAKLLSPEDFGLIGMASVVIGFISLFKDLGTAAAVVQHKNPSDTFLSSIFWINVVFGILATTLLVFAAPIIAHFYLEPRVEPVLQVLSITFTISGLSILHQAYLERGLAFAKVAKLEIASALAGGGAGIVTALYGCGVWSLVVQTVVMALLSTALLWRASPWRPSWVFDLKEVQSISGYSLNLAGYNIFNYVVRNADYLLIGRFLGAQSLGYYTLAYRIMLYPLQSITVVISRVMFPVYASLQDDLATFRRAYLKITSAISLITFPLMAGLWGLASPFVQALFGQQWQPVIHLLMVLAPVGMIQSVAATVGPIYQARGKTDWLLRWGIVTGILAVGAFVLGLNWGVLGVASAYAILSVLLTVPGFAIPFRLIGLQVSSLAAILARPLAASIVMLTVLIFSRTLMPTNISPWTTLATLVPLGIATYLGISWVINRDQLKQTLCALTGRQ